MNTDLLYFDYNATTPILPEVVDAMLPYLRTRFGNPSSGHAFGVTAKQGVERARTQLANLIGASADEIVFTSGGTEANNLAIRGIVAAAAERLHVVTSVIEHPATDKPCTWLAQNGYRVTRAGVSADGRVRIDEVENALSDGAALVTVMHSNNETGVLQPIAEIVELTHRVGAVVHTDAAQSLGKVRIDVNELGVDLLSLAGHKLYAPKGVGALYVRRGTALAPFALGAAHERGLRPGTENVASIVGLGVACEIAARDLYTEPARQCTLRDELFARLQATIPHIGLNGHLELRLPNTLNVRFPNASGNALLRAASEIAASTGSACHAGHDAASPVIVAMGVDQKEAVGSVRLSLGRYTVGEHIIAATEALTRAWRRVTL
jgi:cysteine desulfurase